MNRKIILCLMLVALGTGSIQAANELPEQQSYAWQFPISIEQPTEFMAAEIPLEVYRSVADSQLRDIGLYDASGQPIPRIIDHPFKQPEDVEFATPLRTFPVFSETNQSQERLRLLVESGSAVTHLELDSGARSSDKSRATLEAYIVDLREIENEQFSKLEFNWADDVPGFIGRAVIETSDDLLHWQWVAEGTLASLEFEGTAITRNRIVIPGQDQDYLRITWRDLPEQWALKSLRGVRSERGPDESREWLVLDPIERSENGREFIFDIEGFPPIDRAELILPGQNVVVRASLDIRHNAETHWQRAHQGLFYRVSRDGNEITSNPARLRLYRASQWRVSIETGRVGNDVQLRLGWKPERIMFLAQGRAPYSLATGRSQDALENFPQHRLLGDKSLFNMLEDSGEPGVATIGARQVAAGAVVMQGARTWTWRTVLVWIGLVGAVVFVGWLVLSLVRESK
ncbi:MAG TPA: DUF3999 family protein [Xanthomonadales bacterium]|nr:DUF3999 family protein [Xanthomonadales bacterium]